MIALIVITIIVGLLIGWCIREIIKESNNE